MTIHFPHCKSLNLRLYLALLLAGFLPTVYTTLRIVWLGALPDAAAFSIASQLSWIALLYEVLTEALLLPLFFFIGAALHDKRTLENRARVSLLLAFCASALLALFVLVFASPLVSWMEQAPALLAQTVAYVRLESLANVLSLLFRVSLVVLLTCARHTALYVLLLAQMSLHILLDVFFLSPLPLSLDFGVNGIAYANMLTYALLFLAWLRQFGKVSALSALETLVRNLAFLFMVLRMVNVVGAQGTYWLANHFIWSWLLVPVLQLGELIKRDCGTSATAVSRKTPAYFALTATICALWLLSIPLWLPFLRDVLRLPNPQSVLRIVLLSLPFYLCFAFNHVLDSIFYGLGRTDLMLVQSLAVNLIWYGGAFVLYQTGIYIPSLVSIVLLFGIGIVLDSLLTAFLFVRHCKQNRIALPRLTRRA